MRPNFRPTALAALAFAGCLGLSACGNKGPLTLPPKETLAKPVPAAPKPADHNSTAPPPSQ
jgi:predicted small lipoprotein YifL